LEEVFVVANQIGYCIGPSATMNSISFVNDYMEIN